MRGKRNNLQRGTEDKAGQRACSVLCLCLLPVDLVAQPEILGRVTNQRGLTRGLGERKRGVEARRRTLEGTRAEMRSLGASSGQVTSDVQGLWHLAGMSKFPGTDRATKTQGPGEVQVLVRGRMRQAGVARCCLWGVWGGASHGLGAAVALDGAVLALNGGAWTAVMAQTGLAAGGTGTCTRPDLDLDLDQPVEVPLPSVGTCMHLMQCGRGINGKPARA